MDIETGGAPHLDDGDLTRLADGECPSEEERAMRAHAESCDTCRARVDEFNRLSGAFNTILTKAGPIRIGKTPSHDGARRATTPARSLSWHSKRWQLAAVLALIVAAAIVASPARAWFAARWTALITRSAQTMETTDSTNSELVDPATERAVITFQPPTTGIVVEVTSNQLDGALTIAVQPDSAATAAVIGGLGSEGFLVSPQGLRITNLPESTASYIIRLPAYVPTVTLQVGGRVIEQFDVGDPGAVSLRQFPLAAR